MEKNSQNTDRARQFMPFAALRGFTELLREQEAVPEPKKRLSDAAAGRIDRILISVRRGMMVTVTYHDGTAYRTMTGMVSQADAEGRKLRVIKTDIPFDAVFEIKIVDN